MSVPENILAEMRETNDAFCNAIRTRNTDSLARVYAPEALVLPPNVGPVNGLSAIQIFWFRAIHALDVKDATLTTISAEQHGDSVVEVGRCELILADGLVVPGKYVVHWKPEGTQWKWHTDIWNMNQ